jgi:hypothetical protein
MKIDAECTLVVPTPRGGLLSTADFDKSEWEIMYPLFVEEGLVGPSERVNRNTPDVLYLCYDCIGFHFTHTVLCAFTCMFVLYFTFRCLQYVCLHFLSSSGFSARLRALVDPFIVS